jgi:phage terminase large subunit GpA-like protein
MSTPVLEDDLFDRNYKRGDCCEFWVPCLHCGKWHRLDFYNINIDKKITGEFYAENHYKKGETFRYACPKCGVIWTESDRWKAVCSGKFIPGYIELLDDGKPDKPVQFTNYHSARIHFLMLHTSFEPMRIMVCEYVHSKKQLEAGDAQPRKNFRNSREALPWKEDKASGDIEKVKTHIGSYDRDIVPIGCQMLVAGMDVQLDHVWLWVLGFGYLSEVWSISNMRIETGPTDRIENLEKLLPYLTRQYQLQERKDLYMRVLIAAIDTQFNTDTVKQFSVRCRGVVPIMLVAGDDRLSKQSYRVSKESGGAIQVYHLNTCSYKDRLYRLYFESEKPGAGYGHLQKGVDYALLEHLCSEHKVIERKGERIAWIGWKLKKEGLDNHYWDSGYYALAAADLAGQWTIPSPEELVTMQKIEAQKNKPADQPQYWKNTPEINI